MPNTKTQQQRSLRKFVYYDLRRLITLNINIIKKKKTNNNENIKKGKKKLYNHIERE